VRQTQTELQRKRRQNRHSLVASLAFLFVCLSVSSHPVLAEKMDHETHSLVIEKLERVLKNTSTMQKAGVDANTVEIQLRLADLLSERARLEVLSSQGKENARAKRDRQRALQLYQQAAAQTSGERAMRVGLQMAYLFESLGQSDAANRQYADLIRRFSTIDSASGRLLLSRVYSNWADLFYVRGQFTAALSNFEEALRRSGAERIGYIRYRMAWCDFNLGRHAEATEGLTRILKQSQWLRSETSGEAVDTAFQQDIARDLVVFMAQQPVDENQVKILAGLTPESIRVENLRAFASELNRLGKKREVVLVWSYILNNRPSTDLTYEGLIQLAQSYLSLNQPQKTLATLEQWVLVRKSNKCRDQDVCQLVDKQARKLVIDWSQLEKAALTENLLTAYLIYLKAFPADAEMTFWAAQVARQLSKPQASFELFARTVEIDRKQAQAQRAVVAMIEIAESEDKKPLKASAYESYLKNFPTGIEEPLVRYQRARLWYDEGRHQEAAQEFAALAMRNLTREQQNKLNATGNLQKKSADLALDAWALAKQSRQVEEWATKFAKRFPQHRVEYLKIARRSVLVDVAQTVEKPQVSDEEIRTSLSRIQALDLVGASPDERVLVSQNRMALATRSQDLGAMRGAAQQLLGLQMISSEQREQALEKLAFVAEMQLDFVSAYEINKKLQMRSLTVSERELRLAYLAELANLPSRPHYEAVLKKNPSRKNQKIAQTRLVRLASNPWPELKRFETSLAQDPELLGELVLEAYARTENRKQAERLLKSRAITQTPAGFELQQSFAIENLGPLIRRAQSLEMVNKSDAALQRSIRSRLQSLEAISKAAQTAARNRFGIVQVIALSHLARENQRLHQDLLNLPSPKGLSKAQQAQYQKALQARAGSFKTEADRIQLQLDQAWDQKDWLDRHADRVANSAPVLIPVRLKTLRALQSVAPRSARSQIANLENRVQSRASSEQIQRARLALQRDPFSIERALELKNLEADRGRDAMVAYLDTRVASLRSQP